MRFRGVIFDFDGTLVRSHEPVYAVIDLLTRRRRRIPMPNPDEFRELGTREMLALLNVRPWHIPWFTFRARRELRHRMNEVVFEPGLIEVLRRARAAGLTLALVSSNSRANVEGVLRRHGAGDLFTVRTFGSSLFGKRKALLRTIRRLNLPADQVLTVGDETRDLDAAHAAGLKAAAVGWGFHSPARLRAANPDFEFATPADLATCLGV